VPAESKRKSDRRAGTGDEHPSDDTTALPVFGSHASKTAVAEKPPFS